MTDGEVSKLGKVLDKSVMRNIADLGKDVHSLMDIDKDMVIIDEWEEVIGVNDILVDHLDMDVHVLILSH